MPPISNTPKLVECKVKGLDSRRIFRPEAVDAYATRRAGEAWAAAPRFEGWTIAGFTIIGIMAAVFIWLGSH